MGEEQRLVQPADEGHEGEGESPLVQTRAKRAGSRSECQVTEDQQHAEGDARSQELSDGHGTGPPNLAWPGPGPTSHILRAAREARIPTDAEQHLHQALGPLALAGGDRLPPPAGWARGSIKRASRAVRL